MPRDRSLRAIINYPPEGPCSSPSCKGDCGRKLKSVETYTKQIHCLIFVSRTVNVYKHRPYDCSDADSSLQLYKTTSPYTSGLPHSNSVPYPRTTRVVAQEPVDTSHTVKPWYTEAYRFNLPICTILPMFSSREFLLNLINFALPAKKTRILVIESDFQANFGDHQRQNNVWNDLKY